MVQSFAISIKDSLDHVRHKAFWNLQFIIKLYENIFRFGRKRTCITCFFFSGICLVVVAVLPYPTRNEGKAKKFSFSIKLTIEETKNK